MDKSCLALLLIFLTVVHAVLKVKVVQQDPLKYLLSNSKSPSSPKDENSISYLREPLGLKCPPSDLILNATNLTKYVPIVFVDPTVLRERPIPTNRWWGNLIVQFRDKPYDSYQVVSQPYGMRIGTNKSTGFGLQVYYPFDHRTFPIENGEVKAYRHEFTTDLSFSAVGFSSQPSYSVYNWTESGVQLRMCSAKKSKSCIDTALVHGMAFVSANYTRLKPRLDTDSHVVSLEKKQNMYNITLANGQTWLLFFKNKLELKVIGEKKNKIVADVEYNGILRAAILPDGVKVESYAKYVDCIVYGGDVRFFSRTLYALTWLVTGESCATDGLLHLALPHHQKSMAKEMKIDWNSSFSVNSPVRGAMKSAVVKSKNGIAWWKLDVPEEEREPGIFPNLPLPQELADRYKMKETLEKDIDSDWRSTINFPDSVYFYGKSLLKFTQLCLLATVETVVGTDRTLFKKCIDKVEPYFLDVINNNLTFPFMYSTEYGALITNGLFITNDLYNNFGFNMINDHHFHNGYIIIACAIYRYLNDGWLHIEELDVIVLALIRDVFNPSEKDRCFPTFRNFAFYNGHAYAHGASPMKESKDQESYSEEANFYYGVKLFAQVTKYKDLEDLASIVLRINKLSIQTYFQMTIESRVHPLAYRPMKVTGIFFDTEVFQATWFNNATYARCGIQMLPATPLLDLIRPKTFIHEEWYDIISQDEAVQMQQVNLTWMSLLYVNYATIDKETALRNLTQVSMDDGIMRSWALYMAATKY